MTVQIRPLVAPATLTAPEAEQFLAQLALANELQAERWGNDDFHVSPRHALAEWQHSNFLRNVGFTAHVDDRLVGRAVLNYSHEDKARSSAADIGVHADYRERGIASALLAAVEAVAVEVNRPNLMLYTEHPLNRIDPADHKLGAIVAGQPVGDRVIPESDDAVRFVLDRGCELAQVERTNLCELGESDGRLTELDERAAARAGTDYELVSWSGPTPESLIESLAAARARMALDIPAAAIHLDEEEWTPARIRSRDDQISEAGDLSCVVAALHEATGQLSGYSELLLPEEGHTAEQEDTLVLPDHRGNSLGLWMKTANLLRLRREAPERTRVYTWNADENEHMLAINTTLGFRVHGYTATWQTSL